MTPGSDIHNKWCAQVDFVAGYLRQLERARVPILWRPVHEMNGDWFWWGGRLGDRGTRQLYRMMYDRLVGHHRLNNLIWVWNCDRPSQPDRQFADYFPAQVDLLHALGVGQRPGDRQLHHSYGSSRAGRTWRRQTRRRGLGRDGQGPPYVRPGRRRLLGVDPCAAYSMRSAAGETRANPGALGGARMKGDHSRFVHAAPRRNAGRSWREPYFSGARTTSLIARFFHPF